MKRTKTIALIVLILAGLSLSITLTNANAYDVANAKIVRLGMYPGYTGTTDGFIIRLDDLSDVGWTGERQFYLNDTLGKAGLATILTAYSLQKTIWVRLVSTTPGSLVTIVYIND